MSTNQKIPYEYKSEPYPFQDICLERSWEREYFGILFEQGAGKSKVLVDTSAALYARGRIDALVVIAPNGVHKKWIREDLPFSWPDQYGPYKWAIWESGSKQSMRACEDLFTPGPFLRILCINVEALSHKSGYDFLKRFLQSTEALVGLDESSRIKNPDAKRTEALVKLSALMKYRRILTGTPVSQSPFDYYSQFLFLDREIFGCSYFAFKAEYAELVEKDSRLMQAIMQKTGARFAPQVVAKNEDGSPRYKNLDRLKAIIAPHSMRVTKEEAMPWLPPKIYQKRYFKMAPAQRKVYDALANDMKAELSDGSVSVLHKMTLLMRLQQVACGFVVNDERTVTHLFDRPQDNPRIKESLEVVEDTPGSLIIWARFHEDIKALKKVLGDQAVTMYGPDSAREREYALQAFKAGEKKILISNEAVGGIGLNLTVSAKQLFYNNSFSYEDRKQAEDRIHRGGQEKDACLYEDLLAEDSVDEKTLTIIMNKQNIADYMTDFSEFL